MKKEKQIVFEKLTVEEETKVVAGEYPHAPACVNDPKPYTCSCTSDE